MAANFAKQTTSLYRGEISSRKAKSMDHAFPAPAALVLILLLLILLRVRYLLVLE